MNALQDKGEIHGDSSRAAWFIGFSLALSSLGLSGCCESHSATEQVTAGVRETDAYIDRGGNIFVIKGELEPTYHNGARPEGYIEHLKQWQESYPHLEVVTSTVEGGGNPSGRHSPDHIIIAKERAEK